MRFLNILVKKYHVLNCTLICINALVQSKKSYNPAAYNMKHNNTLLLGLMPSAQVKQFQSCLGSFLGILIDPQGGTLIFSAYVGSDPASSVHPKKYQEFQAPQKNI